MKYEVRQLDCYEENGLWYENDSISLGEIEIDNLDEFELDYQEILRDFSILTYTGRLWAPFADLDRFYLTDYYGDGERYELWENENDRPVYAFLAM